MKTIVYGVLVILLFAGCSVTRQQQSVGSDTRINKKTSLEYVYMPSTKGIKIVEDERTIDTVIVHSAFCIDGEAYDAKNLYGVFDKYRVSPHYIIDREGKIYMLAYENDVAHHAGASVSKDGRLGVNAFSIGIEIINSYTDTPTDKQYDTLASLIMDINSRHTIKYLQRHSDIAPLRKSDPWNFDFDRLLFYILDKISYKPKE